MNNTITYKKIIIIACIISILLGIFLHFAYEISSNNAIVGIFTPVNESVWEHLKLHFIPFALFGIFFYFYAKKKFSNIFLITFLGTILGMFTIVVLHYLGTLLFKDTNVIYGIISYIISMMISFYVFYLGIYNNQFLQETNDSTVLGICALTLLFALFSLNTFFPIKLNITKDPITKTYGIYKTS